MDLRTGPCVIPELRRMFTFLAKVAAKKFEAVRSIDFFHGRGRAGRRLPARR
jgi:hypothetical protein